MWMITEVEGQKIIDVLYEIMKNTEAAPKRSPKKLEEALDALNIAGNIERVGWEKMTLTQEGRSREELFRVGDVLQQIGVINDWGINREGLILWI